MAGRAVVVVVVVAAGWLRCLAVECLADAPKMLPAMVVVACHPCPAVGLGGCHPWVGAGAAASRAGCRAVTRSQGRPRAAYRP